MKNLVQRFILLYLFVTFSGLVMAADIPNNTIYYTSTNGAILNPNNKDAFGANIISNTYENGQGIIVFDGDVTSIGDWAFEQCSGLTSIIIPNSVTSIGYAAFSLCYGLTSIAIPNSVTSIGQSAFTLCYGLTSIAIPNSMTSIGDHAFQSCYGLTSITIPNSVTNIGDYAFVGCSDLTSVTNLSTIPQTISSGTFSEYGTLHVLPGRKEVYQKAYYWKNFTIVEDATDPNKTIYYTSKDGKIVTPYQTGAFGANIISNIYENGQGIITFDGNVTNIGNKAFKNCNNLTSIQIPNSVIGIGHEAFEGCYYLTSVSIPNHVKNIGDRAFYSCLSLKSIQISNSVTNIGELAFHFCM